MENKQTKDLELLAKVLNEKELKTVTEAYEIFLSMENIELKNLILRRINDVISMCRYIKMAGTLTSQTSFEILSNRVTNLQIAINNIKNNPQGEKKLKYIADNTDTPLIFRSIEVLDNAHYQEIDGLLKTIVSATGEEQTIKGELKKIVGNAIQVLFARKKEKIIIYDLESIIKPRLSKETYPQIKEICLRELRKVNDEVAQNIYDEMIYQRIHYYMSPEIRGYEQGNKRGKNK